MPRAFVAHGDPAARTDVTQAIETKGWSVAGTAVEDIERAAAAVAQDPPDAVLIWLSTDPERGRRFGLEVLVRSKGIEVPLLFVDGAESAVRRAKRSMPASIYTTSAGLADALQEAEQLVQAMRRAS